jgi:hypothetical protein
MASYHAPQDWKDWSDWLAAGLHGRSRWRLPLVMAGLVFGQGRRVVAARIRAAGLSDDYRDYYDFLQTVGRRWPELGRRVLVLVLRRVLADMPRVLIAIDDSPTKRYGPEVQGAGLHHDPTPGPAGAAFHNVKEVWGSGQQQVRNLWSNIACWHLNLWLYTLVELWAWNKSAKDLTHRDDSPWDDPHRRPSHADRRKTLQAACLAEEFSQALRSGPLPQKIRNALKRLLRITL